MKKNALTAILITLLLSSALITIAAGVENPRGRRHEKPSKLLRAKARRVLMKTLGEGNSSTD